MKYIFTGNTTMPILSEARCYHCTNSIPEDALNCPNCGKERRELYEIRVKWRAFACVGAFLLLLGLYEFVDIRGSIWRGAALLERGRVDRKSIDYSK